MKWENECTKKRDLTSKLEMRDASVITHITHVSLSRKVYGGERAISDVTLLLNLVSVFAKSMEMLLSGHQLVIAHGTVHFNWDSISLVTRVIYSRSDFQKKSSERKVDRDLATWTWNAAKCRRIRDFDLKKISFSLPVHLHSFCA